MSVCEDQLVFLDWEGRVLIRQVFRGTLRNTWMDRNTALGLLFFCCFFVRNQHYKTLKSSKTWFCMVKFFCSLTREVDKVLCGLEILSKVFDQQSAFMVSKMIQQVRMTHLSVYLWFNFRWMFFFFFYINTD